jgi:hypothetical protein
VIELKISELFKFCDLKTNLHIQVHAFPCYKVSNLFPLIFIEILARGDMQRTNLSGIFKLNSVFERTISCNDKSGFNLKIPDTAKEIM